MPENISSLPTNTAVPEKPKKSREKRNSFMNKIEKARRMVNEFLYKRLFSSVQKN
jgi:hypothetical protein